MNNYMITLSDEGGEDRHHLQSVDDESAREEARASVQELAEEWCLGGEWGDHGSSITVHWSLSDESGDDIDSDVVTVEIEPDHESLIVSAVADPCCGASWRPEGWCGDAPEDHDWATAGEGGCEDNPGVWGTGGTSMVFHSHCSRCGLRRTEHHTGSQRNPGEHDTVEYEYPEVEILAARLTAACSEEGHDVE